MRVADIKKWIAAATLIVFAVLSGLVAHHVTGVTAQSPASSPASSTNAPSADSGGFFGNGNDNSGGIGPGGGNSSGPVLGSGAS